MAQVSRGRGVAGVLVLALLLSAGCTAERLGRLTQENGTDFDPGDLEAHLAAENRVVTALAYLAGINVCPLPGSTQTAPVGCRDLTNLGATEWPAITRTGLSVADRECDQYLEALFWFDRAQRRTVDQIGLTAVAAAAITGLTGGSAEVISIMTSAFGAVGATVQNVGSGLLYEIGPSAVYEVIERQQRAYIDTIIPIIATYDTRPKAMWAIQSYAALCLPPVIETEIRRVVANAKAESQTPASGAPPQVSSVTRTTVIVSSEPADIIIAESLHKFIKASDANLRSYYDAATKAGLISEPFSLPLANIIAELAIRDGKNSVKNAQISKDLNVGG